MPLLADENFPYDAVIALRETGDDVIWIHEIAPGIVMKLSLLKLRQKHKFC